MKCNIGICTQEAIPNCNYCYRHYLILYGHQISGNTTGLSTRSGNRLGKEEVNRIGERYSFKQNEDVKLAIDTLSLRNTYLRTNNKLFLSDKGIKLLLDNNKTKIK